MIRFLRNSVVLTGLVATAFVTATSALAQPAETINAGPYVPTPMVILKEMMRMAEIKSGEFVIDLGSGDGRLVTTAAKEFGARGFGVELKPELVELANNNAKKEGVGDRVKFIQADLFKTDVKEANVITLYLLPSTVTKLVPKFLIELRPGTRIVSHDYPLVPWEAEKVEEFNFQEKLQISGTTRTVLYRYIVPAKVAGNWEARLPASVGKNTRLRFTTDPTLKNRGSAEVDGRSVSLADIQLRGDALSFTVPPIGGIKAATVFRGQINGNAVRGTADGLGDWSATLTK
ncbi:MAG: methyltransferase domain-containing protein [Burkholderiales bacterium]